jgi:hypothetical protein
MKSCDERCVVPDSGRAAGLSEAVSARRNPRDDQVLEAPAFGRNRAGGPPPAYPRADPARPCGPGDPGVALRPGVPLRPRGELTGRKIAGRSEPFLTSVPVRLVFFTSTLLTLLLAIWRLPICLTAYAAEADFGPHRLASQKVMAPLDSLRRVSSAHFPGASVRS